MRRLLPFILLIALTLAATDTGAGHGPGFTFVPGAHLRFEHLTIDNGLSQNAGLTLLQDSLGYIWIGTQDGLNRYDGYRITQYKHDPEDPETLSQNGILALYEDSAGFLWIGTWGGGLNRFDPKTGKFIRFQPDPSNPSSLSHPVVTEIIGDEHGVLWVGTLGGLDRFDPENSTFTHFRHNPADEHSLSSDAISTILPAGDGKLWVGTGAFSTPGAGLNLFDSASGAAQRFTTAGECFTAPNVSALQPAGNGDLWIAYGGYGVSGGGIDRYNPTSGVCTHYDSASTFDNQITDNNITSLLLDDAGGLWATSWSSGVWYLAYGETDLFAGIQHNPADTESLSNDNTFSILQDRTGMVWVGTLSAGVNTLNLDTLQFRTYRSNALDPLSLPSNHVGSFAETSDGALWVGTWENGLARFDPASGAFTRFRNDPKSPGSLSSDLVMSLHADSDGSLWVGTLGGGLNHYDPRTALFTRYQNDPDNPASLLENQVTSIARDPAGRLWVGNFAGISRLDPGEQNFVNYPMPAPPVAFKVIEDELWIGTWGGGVSRLDLTQPASLEPANAAFSTMAHDPANPNSLSENSVWSILQSPDGLVWLGTQGGLNRFNPKTGEFKVYTEKDGLRNATILGILQDAGGFLWLTTNNGLAKFNPQAESFLIYDKSDGLQGNEFNSNAYFQASTGEFYVGGVSGFSSFDPLSLRQNTTPPTLVITNFSIFNNPQRVDPSGSAPVRLNYDQNFISFEFAALDFRAPHKNQFAYMLEGFDDDWVQAGTRNFASYTNLPGGDYIFHVRAANSAGVWSENDLRLPLSVIPPFWLTWPFMVSVSIGLALLVLGVFQWRMREVRRHNVRLQIMVDEQRRVESELRFSEARFRAAFESSAIGMGILSIDGDILAVNAAVCEMTGYSEEELKQRNDRENIYPPDAQLGMDLYAEMLAGKRPYFSVERRYVRKTGAVFWTFLTLSLVRDRDGQPSYLVVMIEDIDDEKRTLAELRESEARFRAMYENAAIGISLIAPDGRVISVNPVLQALSGRTEDELRRLGGQAITYPEDVDVGRQEFTEVLRGERDSYQVEKRYVHKDGRIQWMKQSISSVRDETGKVLYLVVIAEDIDARKRAEVELRQSEARFKAMFENSAVGIGLMSLDRAVIAANPALCEMYGRSCDELIGQTPELVTYPEDYPASTDQYARLVSGEIDHFISERRYVHKNGTVFWAQISMSMVSEPGGAPLYLVGVVTNIDAQKQAQARLAAQETEYRLLLERRIAERTEELNRANEMLRAKAAQDAVIAERTRLARDLHDAVTQTLFSTTLIAEVLPDIWDINPSEGLRRLEELRQLTRGALAEMRTLLVELRPNALLEVPLPTLLRQLTEAMVGRARMKIQFNVEGDCKLPGDVQVGLYRIAQEALNNVVKHARANQAVVTLWMSEGVRLTVADDGKGFDPGTVTADHLGLKIMRERAEAIGARFSLYSEPGEGTQISVVWS